jgi:hypothetical protein
MHFSVFSDGFALPRVRQDEFRRHRSTDNPLHIVGFLSQWKMYLDSLAEVHGGGGGETSVVGKKLTPELLDKVRRDISFLPLEHFPTVENSNKKNGGGMCAQGRGKKARFADVFSPFVQLSEEQIGQLHELLLATRTIYNSPEEPDGSGRSGTT